MPYLKVHEVDVHYRDGGSGPAVVLGHSSAGSSAQWRDLFGRLSGRYRLLAPDHLGYGRTGAFRGDRPLMEHEVAIIAAVAARAGGPVHLVGHSFGAAVLARFAARQPSRVCSLTLIEPPLFHLLESWGRSQEYDWIRTVATRVVEHAENGEADAAARAFTEYWIGPGAYDRMEERVQRTVLAGTTKLRVELPTAFEPWGASAIELAALDCPVLLIEGDQTTAAAHGVMNALREVWPRARHESIEGAGHMAPLTHADRVGAIVEEFLDRLPGSNHLRLEVI